MERVRGKLHSRTGASMLIALMFFLVTMTVGAVVLTAASSNAGRVERNRKEQQNYLAVASAVDLVREDISGAPGGSFTGSYKKTVVETYHPAEYDAEGNKKSNAYTTRETFFAKEAPEVEYSRLLPGLVDALDAIYDTTVPAETNLRKAWDVTKDTELELEITAADMPVVKGNLIVTPNDSADGQRQYGLTVTLGLVPEREGGASAYSDTLSFYPKVTSRVEPKSPEINGRETTYITHYITTVTWEAPVITKGAG